MSYALWRDTAPVHEAEVARLREALRETEEQRFVQPAWAKFLALAEVDDPEVTDERRQQAIRSVVERVTVKPAVRRGPFDPSRVSVDFR